MYRDVAIIVICICDGCLLTYPESPLQPWRILGPSFSRKEDGDGQPKINGAPEIIGQIYSGRCHLLFNLSVLV